MSSMRRWVWCVCVQTIAYQLILELNWAPTKSMESCTNVKNKMKRKPVSRPRGPRCTTSHQTLISGCIFPPGRILHSSKQQDSKVYQVHDLRVSGIYNQAESAKKSDRSRDHMAGIRMHTIHARSIKILSMFIQIWTFSGRKRGRWILVRYRLQECNNVIMSNNSPCMVVFSKTFDLIQIDFALCQSIIHFVLYVLKKSIIIQFSPH